MLAAGKPLEVSQMLNTTPPLLVWTAVCGEIFGSSLRAVSGAVASHRKTKIRHFTNLGDGWISFVCNQTRGACLGPIGGSAVCARKDTRNPGEVNRRTCSAFICRRWVHQVYLLHTRTHRSMQQAGGPFHLTKI